MFTWFNFFFLLFFFWVHVKVVLRAVCVVVVAGVGETELLLHLRTSFGPFKKVRVGRR